MPHAELARNGGSGGVLPGDDGTLGGLVVEAKRSCKGVEGGECLHGRRGAPCGKCVVGVGQRQARPIAATSSRPLQCEGKQGRPEEIALPHPVL
jgi:hypothetical protein